MNDRDFLMWLHERMVNVFNVSPCVDYLHKLRHIIANTPEDRKSPDCKFYNDLNELRMDLKKENKELNMKASDWIPFSKQQPADGQKCIYLHSNGSVYTYKFLACEAKDFPRYTHWMPFVAPEPDDGFEAWWVSTKSIDVFDHPYREVAKGIYATREQSHAVWQAAQAAIKKEKL